MTAPAEVRLESHAAKQFDRAPSQVWEDLRRKAKLLARDPQAGTFIAPHPRFKQSLARWRSRVGLVESVWNLDLTGGWRALCTIGSDGPLRVVHVLELVDHQEYDRLLGYA